ncbi:MAG: aromatic amino acid transport family protein [Candidatus Woesearchaeota archaeon]
MKKEYEAVATLIGTVIGAGVLGIPYVVAQAGLLTGLFDILLLGVVVTILYLLYGEVVLRTRECHQLTGYAERYLGKIGKHLATFSMLAGIYGALIAYLIGVSSSLGAIFGGNTLFYMLGFFLVMAVLIYIGLEAIEKSEGILMIFVLASIVLICVLCIHKVDPQNLTGFDFGKLLVPYGVVLFAFMGAAAIPEMREELKGEEAKLRRAIVVGMVVPTVLYALFSLVVVGVVGLSGFKDQTIATIALSHFVGEHIGVLGNAFAVFAMATSFLALGLALQEMFVLDFKMDKRLGFLLTCSVPLIVALSNVTNFIGIIQFSGVIVGGITALLIVLMHHSAQMKGNRKPEFRLNIGVVGYCFIALLVLVGIINMLIS